MNTQTIEHLYDLLEETMNAQAKLSEDIDSLSKITVIKLEDAIGNCYIDSDTIYMELDKIKGIIASHLPVDETTSEGI